MTLPTPIREDVPPESLSDGYDNRLFVEDDDFDRLIASIREHGILQPVGVLKSGRMLWGRRRRRAAMKLGLKLIPAAIYPDTLTEGMIIALTMQENLLHKALTAFETFTGIKQFKAACPEMPQKEIAKAVGMSEGMVSQFLALERLCTEAMDAFKAGTLGTTKAYKVATSENQLGLLALFQSGETREEVSRRERRSASPATERVGRIRIPLVGGATVTIAAEAVGMEEALEAALEAAKQIKAAIAKGVTAKSAQAYWRDVAAAG